MGGPQTTGGPVPVSLFVKNVLNQLTELSDDLSCIGKTLFSPDKSLAIRKIPEYPFTQSSGNDGLLVETNDGSPKRLRKNDALANPVGGKLLRRRSQSRKKSVEKIGEGGAKVVGGKSRSLVARPPTTGRIGDGIRSSSAVAV